MNSLTPELRTKLYQEINSLIELYGASMDDVLTVLLTYVGRLLIFQGATPDIGIETVGDFLRQVMEEQRILNQMSERTN